jgi:DNA-binding response OmpR family regulator
MDSVKTRILIVEDNPGLARALEFSFGQAGFEATVRYNGADAWEMLQHERFDVLVLDHEMPGLTGLELCRLLRASTVHAETPIVMVTGRELELDKQRIQAELKLAAVYPKPYSPRALVSLVRDLTRPRETAPA